MGKVIIIGGGWSGCGAALTARRAGASVELIEKTDMLVGLGNVGGIFRNNGRYTAAEETLGFGTKLIFFINKISAFAKSVRAQMPSVQGTCNG